MGLLYEFHQTITANSAFHSHLVIYTSKKSFPTRDCIKLAGSGNNNSMLVPFA
jgi:hypothetical protein